MAGFSLENMILTGGWGGKKQTYFSEAEIGSQIVKSAALGKCLEEKKINGCLEDDRPLQT